MPTAVLEAAGLRFGYGSGPAIVDGIGMTLRAGEVVGLFGASGSGKSTVLRLLAGLEHPASGTVRLDGRAVTGPTKAIGLMFQSYALFEWATCLDNVQIAMRMAGLRPTRAACRERLDTVGLAASADAVPRTLSGGMRQRLALARAIAVAPRVLLLDEPFSALDPATREAITADTVRHVRDNGLAAIIVSHDPGGLMPHCDRALVIAGSPASLRKAATVPDASEAPHDLAAGVPGIASVPEAVKDGGQKELR